MGYIRDGQYIATKSQDTRLVDTIIEEIKVVFEERFGMKYTEARFNHYLSSQEQNDVTHVASVRVQERRRHV